MNTKQLISDGERYMVRAYGRPPFVLEHGSGVEVWDSEGNRYLDFTAGIAVNALGHADPQISAVIAEQAARLTHVSNLYWSEPGIELAKLLVETSFADRVFLCNSGTEAVEGAIKFARKVARERHGDDKTAIVAFEHGFHGRTTGALAITHKAKYREPFEPLLPDVRFAPFNDLAAAEAVIDHHVCAVVVEPIQGEGGITPATQEFLYRLRELCDRHAALLVFDEIQCGLGRTGTLWAHQGIGVTPDIMVLAKPLANGLPIGAILATEAVAEHIQPGDHGSTFAGGPLICAVALAVLRRLADTAMLEHVSDVGKYLREIPGSAWCRQPSHPRRSRPRTDAGNTARRQRRGCQERRPGGRPAAGSRRRRRDTLRSAVDRYARAGGRGDRDLEACFGGVGVTGDGVTVTR